MNINSHKNEYRDEGVPSVFCKNTNRMKKDKIFLKILSPILYLTDKLK